MRTPARWSDFTVIAYLFNRNPYEYLTRWLQGRAKTRAPRTRALQEDVLRYYIMPVIGDKRLQKLTPYDLQKLFDGMTARDLGASTQRQTHLLLLTALKDALRVELIPRNVAELIRPSPPRCGSEELRAFTPEEAAAFLTAAQADHRGAVLISANARPRSGKRRQTRAAAASSEPARPRRSTHAARFTCRQMRCNSCKISGPARANWRLSTARSGGRRAGCLPTRTAVPCCPTTCAAGIRRRPIHGLRHTYASLRLRHGVPVEVISKQLGHATVAFTLSIYRTVYQSEKAAWAVNLNELLETPVAHALTPMSQN